MTLNVNLGSPYEAIISKLISRGYAANQTEAIRYALTLSDRVIDEEEAMLVNRAIEAEMAEIESGKVKTRPLEEVLERQYRKRGL